MTRVEALEHALIKAIAERDEALEALHMIKADLLAHRLQAACQTVTTHAARQAEPGYLRAWRRVCERAKAAA